jgi:hypothetical protein
MPQTCQHIFLSLHKLSNNMSWQLSYDRSIRQNLGFCGQHENIGLFRITEHTGPHDVYKVINKKVKSEQLTRIKSEQLQ